jgi:hypothetical protein
LRILSFAVTTLSEISRSPSNVATLCAAANLRNVSRGFLLLCYLDDDTTAGVWTGAIACHMEILCYEGTASEGC